MPPSSVLALSFQVPEIEQEPLVSTPPPPLARARDAVKAVEPRTPSARVPATAMRILVLFIKEVPFLGGELMRRASASRGSTRYRTIGLRPACPGPGGGRVDL